MIDRSGWRKVRFGDVTNNLNQRTKDLSDGVFHKVVGLEHMDSGNFHVAKWEENDGFTSFSRVFRKGQTLFGKRRAYQKKIAVADFDGICSGDILVFESMDENVLLSSLLPFICTSKCFYDYVESNSQGSLSPRVSFSALSQYEFLLPPIDEQKRITKILWAVDNVVQRYVSMYNALDTIKFIQMNELAETITNGREQCSLGEIVEYESGQVDPKEPPYRDMPLVAPNHVESGTGKVLEIVSAAEQNAISGKYKFSKGQIVYSKIRPNLNKVFIADFEGLCSADMYPLKPKNSLLAEYLYYVLISKSFLEYATTCSVRTSIPKLNRKDMSSFPICCPDLQSQNEFVDKMKQVDTNVEKCRTHIDNSRTTLNNLINYYLGGAD